MPIILQADIMKKNNNQNYNTIRDTWDSKTYEQQQELLKNNPSLKE
jgi:hypothetical protein